MPGNLAIISAGQRISWMISWIQLFHDWIELMDNWTRCWENFVEPWIMFSTVLPNKGTHCTRNVLSLMVNCRVSVSTKNVDDAPAFIDLNGFVMSACSSLKWWDRWYRRAILLIRKVLFIGSLVFYQMCNVCTYICFSYVATAAHGHLVVLKLSISRGHYSTK